MGISGECWCWKIYLPTETTDSRMKRVSLLAMVVAVCWAGSAREDRCLSPQLDDRYTNQLFRGTWYEIGKYQTLGGAFFQRGCMCDVTEVTLEDDYVGDGSVTYTCNKDSVDGIEQSATAELIYDGTPGHFMQKHEYGTPLTYNLVYIDEDSAIEYDCGTSYGITNYCVHFMSRGPTMTEEKLQKLMAVVDDLGLNVNGLEYESIVQEGCW